MGLLRGPLPEKPARFCGNQKGGCFHAMQLPKLRHLYDTIRGSDAGMPLPAVRRALHRLPGDRQRAHARTDSQPAARALPLVPGRGGRLGKSAIKALFSCPFLPCRECSARKPSGPQKKSAPFQAQSQNTKACFKFLFTLLRYYASIILVLKITPKYFGEECIELEKE